MSARLSISVGLFCSILMSGCALTTNSVVRSSVFSEVATAKMNRVIVYLECFPSWEDKWRERLAKHIHDMFVDHEVEARVIVMSELRLNQERYIADQEAEFGPLYRLRINQVRHFTGVHSTTVTFRLQLSHAETELDLWLSEIETRPSRYGNLNNHELEMVGRGMAPAVATELRKNDYLL